MARPVENSPQYQLEQLSGIDLAVPAVKTFRRWGNPKRMAVVRDDKGETEFITAARGQAGENHSLRLTAETFLGAEIALYLYGNGVEDLSLLLDPLYRGTKPKETCLAEAKIGYGFAGVSLGNGTFQLAFTTESRIYDPFDPSSAEGEWLLGAIGYFGKQAYTYRQSAGSELTQPRYRNPMHEVAQLLGIGVA